MKNERLKSDIRDILKCKFSQITVPIFQENIKSLEEILEKDLEILHFSGSFAIICLTKMTEKDVSVLEEYLDYIKFIEN